MKASPWEMYSENFDFLQEEKVKTLNKKLEHVIVQATDRTVSVQQFRQEIKVYENEMFNGSLMIIRPREAVGKTTHSLTINVTAGDRAVYKRISTIMCGTERLVPYFRALTALHFLINPATTAEIKTYDMDVLSSIFGLTLETSTPSLATIRLTVNRKEREEVTTNLSMEAVVAAYDEHFNARLKYFAEKTTQGTLSILYFPTFDYFHPMQVPKGR